MPDIRRHLDHGSRLVILVTLALFVAALFFKGFSHDLLLEAGVFLVSVKLIIMAYRSSVDTKELNERLDDMQRTLMRMEGLLESNRPVGLSEGRPGSLPGAPVDPCCSGK